MTITIDGQVFRAARGGAQFTARGDVQSEIVTAQFFDDIDSPRSRTKVSRVALTQWGTYEQNGYTDNAARVEVTYWFSSGGLVAQWTKATTWNGGRWVDFAEGGRNAIAKLVADALVAQVDDWHEIARQAHAADVARRAESKRSEAARALAEAERWEREPMPPIFTPSPA
jgi:hypothetical protein